MEKILGGLAIGIFLGYVIHIPANEKICAVILLAALDSISGGIAAKLNLKFSDTEIIGNFFINLIFGFILILFGKFFELELYYIALLIFALRIFKNISALKEFFLKKFEV